MPDIGNEEMRRRIEWVDAIKALAIFLVVYGHVLLSMDTDITIAGKVSSIIYLFHMPFFFMISGIVFALFSKYNNTFDLKKIIVKRIINLLVPTIFFECIFFIIYNSNRDMFFYYNITWYLTHLMIIILITGVKEYLVLCGKKSSWILITCILLFVLFGGIQSALIFNGDFFYAKFAQEISKFFGYYVSFYIGWYLIKNKVTLQKWQVMVSAIVFVVLQFLVIHFELSTQLAFFKIPCGITGGIVLVWLYSNYRKCCYGIEKVLALYSLEIYLIHNNFLREAIMISHSIEVGVFGSVVLLIIYLLVPLVIAWLEKYIVLFDFIFHPCRYLSKTMIWKKIFSDEIK